MVASNIMLAQVGINADNSPPDPSAILDVKSATKGMLVPRLTQVQISAIAIPADGLIVYCITDDKFYAFVANSNVWKEILFGSGTIAPSTLLSVTTTSVSNIGQTTATSGGNVTSYGGSSVTARGICWSTSPNPTILDYHTTDGTGTGSFTSNLTGLSNNTFYYIRAYAINSLGTAYGNEVTFSNALYIGKSFGGGVIVYLDDTYQHGLIAANDDYSGTAAYGCPTISIPTVTAIGSGQSNTTAIVSGCTSGSVAAQICDNLVSNSYSDWFLPSKDELNQLIIHKDVLTNWSGTLYWSSSQYDLSDAWSQYLVSGVVTHTYKNTGMFLRCMRTF